MLTNTRRGIFDPNGSNIPHDSRCLFELNMFTKFILYRFNKFFILTLYDIGYTLISIYQ